MVSKHENLVLIGFELVSLLRTEEKNGSIILTDALNESISNFEKNWRQPYPSEMKEIRNKKFVFIAIEVFLAVTIEIQSASIIVTDDLKKVLTRFEKNWKELY